MYGVSPGVLFVETKSVLAPGFHKMRAEAVIKLTCNLAFSENSLKAVDRLEPRADKLRVVYLAVLCLCGLLGGWGS